MKTLPGQRLRDSDYAAVKAQIVEVIHGLVFKPLVSIIQDTNNKFNTRDRVLNAEDDALYDALKRGTIQYAQGVFSGDFRAATAKELRRIGAQFDKRSGVYRIPESAVPAWIKEAAFKYTERVKAAHESIKDTLKKISANIDQYVDDEKFDEVASAAKNVELGFRDAAKAYQTFPELADSSRIELIGDYHQNLRKSIKDFSGDMVLSLRETVDRNAEAGYRFDRLVDGIRYRYSTTQSKAEFLARQETSMFMSSYRRLRFAEAGITRYRWRGAKDERERPDHRALEGKIFSYDNPPVVDRATGRKGNPGQDFQCRCVDEPVIDTLVEA